MVIIQLQLRRQRRARSPLRRPEAGVRDGPERSTVRVRGIGADGVAPPHHNVVGTDRAVLRILQAEEDQDDGDGHTRVETRRQDV